MAERCTECGLRFHREPGFYLGSIYFNYGLTAILVTVGYVVPFALGRRPGPWAVAALATMVASVIAGNAVESTTRQ